MSKLQVDNSELIHFGVKGMRWGHHKKQIDNLLSKAGTNIVRTAYSLGAQINPREFTYKLRKITNKADVNAKLLSDYTKIISKQTGILPTNKNALKAIETMEIDTHKKAVYNNLNDVDIERLKTYTDSARYSRSVNGYLAIGEPKSYAGEASKLKQTLQKNKIEDQVVYRSCNLKFSTNGVAKKLDTLGETEMQGLIILMVNQ